MIPAVSTFRMRASSPPPRITTSWRFGIGGSPTNLCVSFLAERKVEVVTGVNLPMMLKLGSLRGSGKPIAQIAQELAEAGKRAIGHVSDVLRSMG